VGHRNNKYSKLWLALGSLTLFDSLISYLSGSLGAPSLSQPWILITGGACVLCLLDSKVLLKIPADLGLAALGLVSALAIGAVTIDYPEIAGLTGIRPRDLASISIAYLVGFCLLYHHFQNPNPLASMLLVIGSCYAIVCALAVFEVNPGLFPMIDKEYYRNGIPVSRPEITTDQTRQVLYLFVAGAVLLVSPSLVKKLLWVACSLITAIVLTRVQSRWGSLVFGFSTLILIFMSLRLQTLSRKAILALLLLTGAGGLVYSQQLLDQASDLIWRFSAIDSSYGGRLVAIDYLLIKLADPTYWIPTGYKDFFSTYGAAPHSFPTMIYLSGGIVGFVCFLRVLIWPTVRLGIYFLRGKTQNREAVYLAFYLSSASILMQLTQPVITLEIFWFFGGLAAGATSRLVTVKHSKL